VSGACRDEALALLELADGLTDAVPGFGRDESWRADVERLLGDDALESFAGERRLDELTARLREGWLATAEAAVRPQWKSPPLGTRRRLPRGGSLSYNYERALVPEPLEARLAAYRPAPPGWAEAHLAFASGMAALSTWLQTYVRAASAQARRQPRAALWGGYFETHILFDLLSGPGFSWFAPRRQEQLVEATRAGRVDLVLVEPVTYDWHLHVLDLDTLVDAWSRRAGDRPSVLLLDTTLSGEELSAADVLDALRDAPPRLVAVLSSGSKLEQQGLELANVGFLSLYTRDGIRPAAGELARFLRKARSTLGTGLSLRDTAVLDAPFVLDPERSRRFARAVYDANARLASAVRREGGLFSAIVHPSRRPAATVPWAVGPFVVFRLREDAHEHYRLLLAVVREEARRRSLALTLGSSFGFRGDRFEAIRPEPVGPEGLFKVALGARGGPSAAGAAELLEELAACPDMATLRRSFRSGTSVPVPAVR
jgi:hypothetical protein